MRVAPLIWVGVIVVLLILMVLSELARALLLGWVSFLWRVLPRMRIHWGTIAVSATALVLFAGGIHWIASGWFRRKYPETIESGKKWKMRWSLALVAGVILMFAAGTSLIGMVHQASWLATSPEPMYGSALKTYATNYRNLKEIGMGLQNHNDTYGSLPSGWAFSKDGTPLHSWETRILPFIGYAVRELDLKRSWNDPANLKHFQAVVPEFINPDLRTAEFADSEGLGLSHYAANCQTLGGNEKRSLDDFQGKLSSTILVGEVNVNFQPWGQPVNWRDPSRGINKSPYGFGGPANSGGAQFIMADGSVRFVSEKVSPDVLRTLAGSPQLSD